MTHPLIPLWTHPAGSFGPAKESATWAGVEMSGQIQGVSVIELCGLEAGTVPPTLYVPD